MPHGDTKFKSSWLTEKDGNGHKIGDWLQEVKNDQYVAKCIVCTSTFKCSNSGLKQVLQHAEGQKHKDKARARFSATQQRFFPGARGGDGTARTHTDLVTMAEAAWAMKVAASKFSYSSCDDLPELFKFMFPGSIANDFTMSKGKISYLISDGLGPFFEKQLSKMVRDSSNPYIIQFDETGTVQDKKECDTLVRFWDNAKGEVVTRFLKALFFGHAKGKDVAQALLNLVQEYGFDLALFLNIGSDGPNVNKTVWNEIDGKLKRMGYHGLLGFNPCNIHTVHNGFKNGVQVYGQQAEELAIDLFYWFKGSPCRKEDYFDTQMGLDLTAEVFIRHVQSRWLTLLPALTRILNKMEAVTKYFTIDVPKMAREEGTERTLNDNDRYKRICRKLKDPAVQLQLHFLVNIKPVFDKILGVFQKQEPLVHILHNECLQLVKTLMNRFLKRDAFEGKRLRDLLQLDMTNPDIQCPNQDLEVGESTRTALAKLNADQRKIPMKGMRSFLQVTTKYLMKKLPLENTFLRDLGIFHPDMQDAEVGHRCIRRLAQQLPQVFDPEEIAILVDEYKVYQERNIPGDWIETRDGDTTTSQRIDHYWAKVLDIKTLSGEKMFPKLAKLVKATLCLSHGNADVERSLSVAKKVLGTERTLLTAESINGLRRVDDAVKSEGGKIPRMTYSKEMLKSARHAHSQYRSRLDEVNRAQELRRKEQQDRDEEIARKREEERLYEERKRKHKDAENKMQTEHKELQEELNVAGKLFKDTNDKLARAAKKKDYKEIPVLQAILETAMEKMTSAQRKLDKWQTERESLDRKRMKLLDDAKPKN